MRIILGLFMVAMVSAAIEDTKTITGLQGQPVLLPCNCSGIDLDKGFQWQMEHPVSKKLVFKYNKSSPDVGFVAKDNCSHLLTNITWKDQRSYTCRFNDTSKMYRKPLVILNVLAVDDTKTITGLQGQPVLLPCNCSGINLDKGFQWQMEHPVSTEVVSKYNKSSPDVGFVEDNCSLPLTNITWKDQRKYTCRFNDTSGGYRVHLVILNVSDPLFDKVVGNSTGKPEVPDTPSHHWEILIIIPVVFVLALALFWLYHIRCSKHVQKRTQVPTENV